MEAQLSLDDLLPKLDSRSRDAFLFVFLGREGWWSLPPRGLAPVRLACRSLRDFVDGSITSITLRLGEHDEEQLASGAGPPFPRWISCTTVTVSLPDDAQLAGNLLAMAFSRMPSSGGLPRITSLCVCTMATLSGVAWSSVLRSLPSLQNLNFSSDCVLFRNDGRLPSDRLEQRLVFNSMASLKELSVLHLNCQPALELVHLLAASLKELWIEPFGSKYYDTSELSAMAVGSISRLHRLQRLCISGLKDNATLQQLVCSIPPSVERLELPYCKCARVVRDYEAPDLELQLEGGHFTSITADGGEDCPVKLRPFLELVCAMAPRCRDTTTGEQRLQKVDVPYLCFSSSTAVGVDKVRQLQALLPQCQTVEVWCMEVSQAAPLNTVLKVLDLFAGGTVNTLWLQLSWAVGSVLDIHGFDCLTPKQQQTVGTPPTATQMVGMGLEQTPLPPAPPNLLADMAVEELIASCDSAPSSSSARTGDPEAATAAEADCRFSRLLLLRGPFMMGLALDPGLLSDFMSQQAAAAVAAAGEEEATGYLRVGRSHVSGVLAFWPLPNGDVLVQCATAAAEAAMRQAAASVGPGTAAVAGTEGTAAQLEVFLVYKGPNTWRSSCAHAYKSALTKAAQNIRGGKGPPSSSWSEAQRLRWLLEQWAAVPSLPDPEYFTANQQGLEQ